MKRYFEVIGQRRVIVTDIYPSRASRTADELSADYGLPLREIDKAEFARLRGKYRDAECIGREAQNMR